MFTNCKHLHRKILWETVDPLPKLVSLKVLVWVPTLGSGGRRSPSRFGPPLTFTMMYTPYGEKRVVADGQTEPDSHPALGLPHVLAGGGSSSLSLGTTKRKSPFSK